MSAINLGLVVEGDTDFELLCSILAAWLGPETSFKKLQPADSSSENGQGWKGIRRWCRQTIDEYRSLSDYCDAIEPRLDAIVIQIDGDVVFEHDIELSARIEGEERNRRVSTIDGCRYDSFPIGIKYKALNSIIDLWLDDGNYGKKEFCFPIDEMEIWIVAAYDSDKYHRPPLYPIEALVLPADSVIDRSSEYHGIKVSRRDGRLKKQKTIFRNFHAQVLSQWETVARICSMAMLFEDAMKKRFCMQE